MISESSIDELLTEVSDAIDEIIEPRLAGDGLVRRLERLKVVLRDNVIPHAYQQGQADLIEVMAGYRVKAPTIKDRSVVALLCRRLHPDDPGSTLLVSVSDTRDVDPTFVQDDLTLKDLVEQAWGHEQEDHR